MEKLYMQGKMFIPEKDVMLCNVQNNDAVMTTITTAQEYERIYATRKGAFYKVKSTAKKRESKIITKDDALLFLEEHAPYIITENYNLILGEPERG